MFKIRTLAVIFFLLLSSVFSFADENGVALADEKIDIKAVLHDAETNEALEFATVSLTRNGATKPSKYILSDDKGIVLLEDVSRGKYTFKAELLGYLAYEKELEIKDKTIDLGIIKMEIDSEMIEAASVSDVGNPVIIKKDTIEYNASSFRTTDNDVLEDLLKKLPGVEIEDNGTIKVNGESVSKITIDGKTFFLDDPNLASQNIPAKMVNKLKVIKKKSEQAEFTGIDDGQEETVIDLSVQPGMMQGLLGNVQAGVGHDIPSPQNTMNDFRYQGNAFVGKFTDNTQLSLIVNANNAGGMGGGMGMGMMMGGGRGGFGGGGGITSTSMIGGNAAMDLFDGDMELAGNYMYNNFNSLSISEVDRINYERDYDLISNNKSTSNSTSNGHSIGMRLEHKFSENTSILFQPQLSFNKGSSLSSSSETSHRNEVSDQNKVNDARTENVSDNESVSASGNFLFRQRLGIPGRTLTANLRFSLSESSSDGKNYNETNYFSNGVASGQNKVDQTVTNGSNSYSLRGNVTFTEPMGDFFYLSAEYSYNWSKSESKKDTYNLLLLENGKPTFDPEYSNEILNEQTDQNIGVNALYQSKKMTAQVGFAAMPTKTYNSTTSYNTTTGEYVPRIYDEPTQWRYSPTVRITADINDNLSLRTNYRGSNNQPSTSQLMPVPDNTNPLNISFGNPSLTPYFSHSLSTNLRYNNRQQMSSFTISASGGLTQNPIVNVNWRTNNGVQFSMPFNGPNRGNASLNLFFNTPIAKSAFSINNDISGSYNVSSAYQGNNIDMTKYENEGYYAFMDEFQKNFQDPTWYANNIIENTTRTFSFNERMRLVYRGKTFETTISGSTRMNKSWYSLRNETTTTWNNNISSSFTWDWAATGISMDADVNYRWYRGYETPQDDQCVLNLEISKLLFNNNVTMAVRAYDLLGQSRNLSVSDTENYHSESVSNTLGRYIIVSFTWRFGTMGNRRGGFGGPMGGGRPMMGGGRPAMPMGGGRPMR